MDIVDMGRMQRSYERFGERLARRILTHAELREFPRARQPVRFLAMRFAAKEAAAKAFGTGFKEGIAPARIGVSHDRRGKPSLRFYGPALRLARARGITAGHVSLSDEQAYAIAYVVLEAAAAPARPRARYRFR